MSLVEILIELRDDEPRRPAPHIPSYTVRSSCIGATASRAEIDRYRPRRGLLRWLLGP